MRTDEELLICIRVSELSEPYCHAFATDEISAAWTCATLTSPVIPSRGNIRSITPSMTVYYESKTFLRNKN